MELKPYTLLDIHPCPFYGFKFDKKSCAMVDTGENQCALIGRTCEMEEVERDKNKLNWYGCTLKNKIELMSSLGNIRVFPREFCPADGKPWKGMSLRNWIEHMENIMY